MMKHGFWFYPASLLIFGLCLYLVLSYGSRLESNDPGSGHGVENPAATALSRRHGASESSWNNISNILRENLRDPLSILLLQVIVILVVAKLVSGLFLRVGQPPVIGEMIAGILLGPSLLGMLFPKALLFLFPPSSMGALRLLSQVGVVLFMFNVGMEMNARLLKEKARAAVVISHASIMAPFLLGVITSLLIYRQFAPANIPFTSFALFMGVAMSITAFPVLARIIEERGMSGSYLGNTTVACAAVDDVTAWCVLSLVIAVVKLNELGGAALTIFLALSFTAFMLFILKPQLDRRFGDGAEIGKNDNGLVVGALTLAFASAYFTEVIGIHALFGAFLAGVAMPAKAEVRSFLREKIGTFSLAALLPLFFAFTGLRTQISLLNDWLGWFVCAGIIAVAIVGKLGGSMLAARWSGMSWPDSTSIGVLMNTRGLMELIVLNIGYDLGILPERIFAIMVLMALVTTCMTSPLLSLIELATQKIRGQERLATTA